MPSKLNEQLETHLNQFERVAKEELPRWRAVNSPQSFRQMELEVHRACRALADTIVESILQERVAAADFQAQTAQAVRAQGRSSAGQRYKDVGRRTTKVTLLGGKQTTVNVEYFRPDLHGRRGRKRGHGRRGKSGVGLYPVLAALGIWFGITPALCGELCRQVSDSDSARAAQAALATRDIQYTPKEILTYVNKFSHRAVAQRADWLARARDGPAHPGPLQGKRVVLATDGGRLRERRQARRGRRRARTGHRGYQAPWREPKVLVIHVVGEDGRIDRTMRPVYDATLGDCEAVFDMLVGYLRALGAHEARELIVLGDGAKWIWNRIAELVERVGGAPKPVTEVVDWCHAVSVLHEMAEVPARWSRPQRDRWFRTAKELLFAGNIAGLSEHIKRLAQGRRAAEVLKHLDYFVDNAARMQYKTFKEAHCPIGSGAVESAVRRIINQRMKGNGTFWKESNAEGMLLLRSYLKADRFDEFLDWSLAQAAPWWSPGADARRSPLAGADGGGARHRR
jgi:hypothetical protein